MLKGLHKTTKRLADGTKKPYYYAWRGGPRMQSKPNTPEFVAEFHRHYRERSEPNLSTLAGLIENYKGKGLPLKKKKTRETYQPLLDDLARKHGRMPVEAIEELGSRSIFEEWRDGMAPTPVKAKLAWAVVRRLFSFSVEAELLRRNPCTGSSGYFAASRREIIWSDSEIALFKARAPKQLVHALVMALETGQRQGDLLRLTWSAYDGNHIRLQQEKTGKHVTIRVSAELRLMLENLDRRAVTILTNSKGQPWTSSGFQSSWRASSKRIGIEGKRFHDLRGTFITKARRAGATIEQIVHASGHSPKTASDILEAHYLATDTAVSDAVILKMERAKQ